MVQHAIDGLINSGDGAWQSVPLVPRAFTHAPATPGNSGVSLSGTRDLNPRPPPLARLKCGALALATTAAHAQETKAAQQSGPGAVPAASGAPGLQAGSP